jgi:hypothetical protein
MFTPFLHFSIIYLNIYSILFHDSFSIFCVLCFPSFCRFFFQMALPAHSGPRPIIQFRNHFSQTVGLLGRVISPSQGSYLNTGQHKHRINAYTYQTIHALSGIRTHDPSFRASDRAATVTGSFYRLRSAFQDVNISNLISVHFNQYSTS